MGITLIHWLCRPIERVDCGEASRAAFLKGIVLVPWLYSSFKRVECGRLVGCIFKGYPCGSL